MCVKNHISSQVLGRSLQIICLTIALSENPRIVKIFENLLKQIFTFLVDLLDGVRLVFSGLEFHKIQRMNRCVLVVKNKAQHCSSWSLPPTSSRPPPSRPSQLCTAENKINFLLFFNIRCRSPRKLPVKSH